MMIEFVDDDNPATTLAALEREVVRACIAARRELGKSWLSKDSRSVMELVSATDTLLAARAATPSSDQNDTIISESR